MAATYDGIAVFGRSVRIDESENPAAWQFASFFGLDGVFSLFGGTEAGRSSCGASSRGPRPPT